jgi:uncharacterized membrane protein YhaH (DUF805 family)
MVSNPYSAPRSEVADVTGAQEFQPVRMWSAGGRIGRLRYLAYTMGASLAVGFVAGAATALLGPTIGTAIALIAYVPLLVFGVFIMIQRSHDMDWSGWMILLALIPLVGLIWIFKPGTAQGNRFGAPPPPNTLGVKILACLFPVFVVLGIAAAIAIPAYDDYVQRAQGVQQAD